MIQQPSIGRVVHYVLPMGKCGKHVPAIVTAVGDGDHVNLSITLDRSSDYPESDYASSGLSIIKTSAFTVHAFDVPHLESMEGGTWHWPERVESAPHGATARTNLSL